MKPASSSKITKKKKHYARDNWWFISLVTSFFIYHLSIIPTGKNLLPAISTFPTNPASLFLDSDFLSNIAMFSLFGFCLTASFLNKKLNQKAVFLVSALVLTLALAFGSYLEALQLQIAGRCSSVQDLLAHVLGASLGVCIWIIYKEVTSKFNSLIFNSRKFRSRLRVSIPPVFLLLLFSIFKVFAFPANNFLPLELALERFSYLVIAPFSGLEQTHSMHFLLNIMLKVGLFIPLGFLASWLSTLAKPKVNLLILCALVPIIIEAIQAFLLPNSTPSSGDIVIGILSLVIGWNLHLSAKEMVHQNL